jgi:hypothetical protein
MTDEQINAAIATACGWTDIFEHPEFGLMGVNSQTHGCRTGIEDYCNDLNAMHQAEETLPDGDLWTMKYNLPSQGGLEFRSTARQRAEAFLRTLGLWEEAK